MSEWCLESYAAGARKGERIWKQLVKSNGSATSKIAKYAACLLGYSNYLYNKNSTVTHIIQSWVKRLLIIETSSKEVEQETHFLVLVAKKPGEHLLNKGVPRQTIYFYCDTVMESINTPCSRVSISF